LHSQGQPPTHLFIHYLLLQESGLEICLLWLHRQGLIPQIKLSRALWET
jgi:hypothetical protein